MQDDSICVFFIVFANSKAFQKEQDPKVISKELKHFLHSLIYCQQGQSRVIKRKALNPFQITDCPSLMLNAPHNRLLSIQGIANPAQQINPATVP